jgi:hypothetical protein
MRDRALWLDEWCRTCRAARSTRCLGVVPEEPQTAYGVAHREGADAALTVVCEGGRRAGDGCGSCSAQDADGARDDQAERDQRDQSL